jgi:hypothetical protein
MMTLSNVQVSKTGNYSLTFRYAFSFGLFPGVTDRYQEIVVNGQVVAPKLDFHITGSMTVFSTVTLTGVQLNAGVNTIQICSIDGQGVARMDTMTVMPV